MVTVNANTILSLLEMNNNLSTQLHKRKADDMYTTPQYTDTGYRHNLHEFESRLQFQVMRYIFPMVNNNFAERIFTVDDFAQLICKDSQKLQFIGSLSNQYNLPVVRFIDKALEILCRLNFLQEIEKDKYIISTRCASKNLPEDSSPDFASDSSSENVIDHEIPAERAQKKLRIDVNTITEPPSTEEPSAWPCWTEKEPKSPEEQAPDQKKGDRASRSISSLCYKIINELKTKPQSRDELANSTKFARQRVCTVLSVFKAIGLIKESKKKGIHCVERYPSSITS